MAAGNAVWGIDIGQCALKALKLRNVGDGQVEVVAFDLIEHAKILSQPDAERDELIRAALEKFASRNDWQGDRFVLGVPGQQTFARFCKMPPVDPKKIPDLVRFEASQQIPFDMDDVVWDYQTFSTEDSPDLEVGIFAMRKDLIRKEVDLLGAVGISPSIVQTLPSALYNFLRFEMPDEAEGGASVMINVGAQNTDLVIVEPNSAWTRNIPLGGNNFTEALVRAFKLSFAKAESLKRTAATSKYARQIFQAMRPVFAELVAEIQRSVGFYSSTHRDVELRRVMALGNAFRLPGLQKYLENNLTITGGVTRLEKFKKIVPSATINAPQFTENVLTFGAAYGLALQGLGLSKINASLLPSELARAALWNKKRPYFMAAAACLGLAAILPFTRDFMDMQALESTAVSEDRVVKPIIAEAQRFKKEYQAVQTNTGEQERAITQLLELRKDKLLVTQLMALVHEAMPPVNPLLAHVESAEELRELAESGRLKRAERDQILIDSLEIKYVEDIDSFVLPGVSAGGGGAGPRPGAPGRPRGRSGGRVKGGAIDMGPINPALLSRGVGPTRRQAKGDKTPGGFHVQVAGRLLHGANQGEAISFLSDQYFQNLRTLGSADGLDFFIPDDDPNDATKRSISRPVARPKRASLSGGSTVRGGRDLGSSELDPVTGEDTSSDWLVEFSFKVKVGEKPQTDEKKGAPGQGDNKRP